PPHVIPLSAVIITLDEERNLPGALASVSFCEEVLVMDWGSTDRTRELAEAAGGNRALAAARHDWVLALDADERVTPALRAEILAERAAGFRHAGYRMP